MFPHTVTVYNKYLDNKVEKWQRTVLKGVFWDSSKGAVVRKTGMASVDGLQLIIPKGAIATTMEVIVIPGEKEGDPEKVEIKSSTGKYSPPKTWANLNDRRGYWTLQSGDTVILGEIDYEVVKSSKELQQFDDILVISNVDTRNYGGGMSHWEVSGK